MSKTLYDQRDTATLGHHYDRHLQALADEGVSNPAQVAAELAHRDQELERLHGMIEMLSSAVNLERKDKDHAYQREAHLEERVRELKERTFERFAGDECWIFQDNGEDYPETLTCPVVMSADKLRELLVCRDALTHLREKADYDTTCEIVLRGVSRVAEAVGLTGDHFEGDSAHASELERGLTEIAQLLAPLSLEYDEKVWCVRLPATQESVMKNSERAAQDAIAEKSHAKQDVKATEERAASYLEVLTRYRDRLKGDLRKKAHTDAERVAAVTWATTTIPEMAEAIEMLQNFAHEPTHRCLLAKAQAKDALDAFSKGA